MMDYLLCSELPQEKNPHSIKIYGNRFWLTHSFLDHHLKEKKIPKPRVLQYAHCDKHLSGHWGVTKSLKMLDLFFSGKLLNNSH